MGEAVDPTRSINKSLSTRKYSLDLIAWIPNLMREGHGRRGVQHVYVDTSDDKRP